MALLIMRRFFSLCVFAIALYLAFVFPVAAFPLLIGLVAYAVLLSFQPAAWLLVVPAMLPVLDFAPWSGRILYNEFDLLLLVTIASGLWQKERWTFFRDMTTGGRNLLIALVLGQLWFTLNGLLPLSPWDANAQNSYISHFNSLRMAKGFFLALLLLPMLQQMRSRDQSMSRWTAAGMLVGLLTASLAILWERYHFTGLFDFNAVYRITGLFSGMHTGGAGVDAHLLMSMPFAAAGLLFWKGRRYQLLALFMLSLVLYGVAVTFTRSDYPALLLSALVFVLGYVRLQRVAHQTGATIAGNARNIWIGGGVLMALILLPVLSSSYIQSRFATSVEDMNTRLTQWQSSIDLMDDDLNTQLLGMGKGRFALNRLKQDRLDGKHPPHFEHLTEADNKFVRFTESHRDGVPLDLRQRFDASETGVYRLKIRIRNPKQETARLLIEICGRNILHPSAGCNWVGINTSGPAGKWVEYNKRIHTEGMWKDQLLGNKPIEISVLNRGLNWHLDLDDIQITGPSGQSLLTNSGFDQGMDYWFYAFADHLAWHIKNLWVDAYFEGGILGFGLLMALLGFILWTLARRILAGDSAAVILLMVITGVLVVGMFDSLFDEPRITVLFFLMVWLTLLPSEASLEAHQVLSHSGRFGWLDVLLQRYNYQPTGTRYAINAMGGLLVLGLLFQIIMWNFQLGAKETLWATLEKTGMDDSVFAQALLPDERYPDFKMDGWPIATQPRILMPELSNWDGIGVSPLMQERKRLWAKNKTERGIPNYPACHHRTLIGNVSCWLAEGDTEKGQKAAVDAFAQLRSFKPLRANDRGEYGDAWQLAVGFDLLSVHPEMTEAIQQQVWQTLRPALRRYLALLDDDSASLWHGRSTLAANAWLVAIALNPNDPNDHELTRRAQSHFMATMRAMALSEGWPEGYNYWINSRGLTLMLASAAYINGLRRSDNAEAVRLMVERLGLWHVYLTRPDHRVEGFGDEGSRVDLKDESHRVIDLITQITRNPTLAAYSEYLGELNTRDSYYREYWTQFALFNDPTVTAQHRAERRSLEGLEETLAEADWFGRDALNQVMIHSGWGPKDTFIHFRAGSTLAHHAHYDAGHFTLFKGKPLASNSSTYGKYTGPNRLNYSLRTVAKNSLLIMRPNEEVSGNGQLKHNISDGGQRVVMPVASNILSVEDWIEKQTSYPHVKGGDINAMSQMAKTYVYVQSDLTGAYNNQRYDDNQAGGKVSSVQRELLYLTHEDRLIVHDYVATTDPSYTKKWLLHSLSRPEIDGLFPLKGTLEAGISQSTSATARIQVDNAYLRVDRILPQNAVIRVIGGKGYRFYVETDGDDSDLDGENMLEGARDAPWFDAAAWRMEIQPSEGSIENHFLVALSPSLDRPREDPVQALELFTENAHGLTTDTSIVVFVSAQQNTLNLIRPGQQQQLIVVGLPANQLVTVSSPDKQHSTQVLTDPAGVMQTPFEPTLSDVGDILELRW